MVLRIDGELVEPLMNLWVVRMTRLELLFSKVDRNTPAYKELRAILGAANRAHTELTSLHIYQKRNSPKVQQQLSLATTHHRKADSLYKQFMERER